MSRFKKLWVLIAPMAVMLVLGTASPVQASPPPQPPAPTPSDVCGVSQDKFFAPNGATGTDVGWKDGNGTLYSAGQWSPTGAASSVVLTAMVWGDTGYAEYTYPAMTFGTESDSSCVEALDTVTTRVVQCNTGTNGTLVEFVYTNTDDATNRAHTYPNLQVVRWDNNQHAYVVWTTGQVADGGQLSVTGGDTADSDPTHFFLAPGTYSLTLRTNETGSRVLPNRLFVPACGSYTPPPGDPMGGPIPTTKSRPKATISKCRAHRVRVVLDARQATSLTRYRLIIDPRHGRTKARVYGVSARTYKVLKLKHQKSGTVIKVKFAGKVVKRKLRC